MNKKAKAKLNKGLLEAAVVFIVLVVLFLSIYAQLVPEAQTAGDSMNDSTICQAIDSCAYNSTSTLSDNCQLNSTNASACGTAPTYIPLASLFAGTGVIFVVIMAALLIVLIGGSLVAMKKGGK